MFYLYCSNIVRFGTSKSTKIILVVIISSDNINFILRDPNLDLEITGQPLTWSAF